MFFQHLSIIVNINKRKNLIITQKVKSLEGATLKIEKFLNNPRNYLNLVQRRLRLSYYVDDDFNCLVVD